MATATKVCKVCGKEYPYCKTFRTIPFRWQDVACCPEHGSEYFRRIMESRGELAEQPAPEPEANTNDIPDEEQDDVDQWDDEDESDED